MGEAEQRDLIDRYVAAYNRFDVDGMLVLVAADVRFENLKPADYPERRIRTAAEPVGFPGRL